MTNKLFYRFCRATVILCSCLLLVCSCSKDDDPGNGQNPGNSNTGENVYIAGYEGNVAKYWKNGVATSLTDGTKNAYATDIFVSGNDVYVAGGEGEAAKYWKNGKAVVLSELSKNETAEAIFVSGSDVYVAGAAEEGLILTAKYWKNGVPVILSKLDSYAWDIFVSGGDVYVAGGSKSGKAMYWKNGKEVYLTDGGAGAIFVSGNDVYVAGVEDSKVENEYYTYYTYIIKYWKNGNALNLTDGKNDAMVTDIFVSGNDVYVCGYEATSIKVYGAYGSGDDYQAKYWKNGEEILLTDKETDSFAYKIYVSGNDVYVAGAERHAATGKYVAKYWKNGTAIALSDGTQHAEAYSIVVK